MSPVSIAALIQALMAVSEAQNDDLADSRPVPDGHDDHDAFAGSPDAGYASGVPEQD